MGKQPRVSIGNPPEPVFRSALTPSQPFVFPSRPWRHIGAQVAKHRVQRRPVVPAIVLYPSPYDRIPHSRQVIDRFVTPQMKSPSPHLLLHLLRRLVAQCRTEVDGILPGSILRPPCSKRVPQPGRGGTKEEFCAQRRTFSCDAKYCHRPGASGVVTAEARSQQRQRRGKTGVVALSLSLSLFCLCSLSLLCAVSAYSAPLR